MPTIFLARNRDPRTIVVANDLGASAILSSDAPQQVLRSTISQLIGGLENEHETRQDFGRVRAHIALATTALVELDARAKIGDPISPKVARAGAEAISSAVDGADVRSWLDIVWKHDDLTFQHSLLVTGLASAFCKRLGLPESEREIITSAALLHDLGKAKVPADLLNKPGKLSAEEQAIMRRHPEWGYSMLQAQVGFPSPVKQVALSHHEFLDGSGYPYRLRGAEISDPVRIVTICDVFAALIERRAYKQPLRLATACRIMGEMRGKIDAVLLSAFCDEFRDEREMV